MQTTHIAQQVQPARPILGQPTLLRPIGTTQDIVDAWLNYQELKSRLLDERDYQDINGKRMICKSGWQKLATAFSLTDEIISEVRKDYKSYFVIEICVRVSASSGRATIGVGSCASNERSFRCQEHDVRSTAHTRAKSRGISSIIGGGEISAEEMQENPFPVTRFNAPVYGDETSHPQESITQNQRTLLLRLIEHRIADPEKREEKCTAVDELSKQDASELISDLLGQPIIR